jgi:hypothetical protein
VILESNCLTSLEEVFDWYHGNVGVGMLVWVWLLSPSLALLGLIFWDITKKDAMFEPIVVLTAVLVLCTAASCAVAFLQWQVLGQTDETYWAGQRPWLGIKSKTELTNFRITQSEETKSASTTVRLTINYYGKIPAIKTKIATAAFVDPDPNQRDYKTYFTLTEFDQKVMSAQDILCSTFEDDQGNGLILKPEGHTIVQKQRMAFASGYEVESTDGPSIFPQESSEVFVDAGVTFPSELKQVQGITIAGCFRYNFGESDHRAGIAVRGKLVQQDADDAPASELLKRIAKEMTGRQAIKKSRRNGEVEVSGLRADMPLPNGWLWTNLDEITLSMRYGTSTKCEYGAPGVPVLRIPNVSNGAVSLHDMKFGPLTEGRSATLR